jgi:hypothetical protein
MTVGPVNRVRLTARLVEALKPTDGATARRVTYDSIVPALAVRLTESGHKSFVLAARFPGSRNQTRRYLGNATGPRAITLAEARRKARAWLAKIGEGIDPKDDIRRQRAAKEAQRAATSRSKKTTFVAVAEEFIATVLPHQRKGRDGRTPTQT